jgi:hypothetical protein
MQTPAALPQGLAPTYLRTNQRVKKRRAPTPSSRPSADIAPNTIPNHRDGTSRLVTVAVTHESLPDRGPFGARRRLRGDAAVEPREFAPALSAVAAGKLPRSSGYERVRQGRGRVPPLWDISR